MADDSIPAEPVNDEPDPLGVVWVAPDDGLIRPLVIVQLPPETAKALKAAGRVRNPTKAERENAPTSVTL